MNKLVAFVTAVLALAFIVTFVSKVFEIVGVFHIGLPFWSIYYNVVWPIGLAMGIAVPFLWLCGVGKGRG